VLVQRAGKIDLKNKIKNNKIFENAKERQCLKTTREKMPLVRQNTNNCIIAPPSYKIGGEYQLGLKTNTFC
jgi:hypothetical protein